MALALEFHAPDDRALVGPALHVDDWRAESFSFWDFDRRVDKLVARGEPLRVVAEAHDVASTRRQITLRTQRISPTHNAASDSPWFTRVLALHRALHDLTRPLVQADLDHALDTWQWSVRLDPLAPAAVQLAALLHDIERLVSEPDARIEHRAVDYQAFKDAHARAGAELSRSLLARAGVPAAIAGETCALIATHERPGAAAAIRAVNDADALSFFSLNCPGYLAYFGPEQTTKKVAYTLARMSGSARTWLACIRMPQLVRGHCAPTQDA